jgi:hypothetical protein
MKRPASKSEWKPVNRERIWIISDEAGEEVSPATWKDGDPALARPWEEKRVFRTRDDARFAYAERFPVPRPTKLY